MLFIKSQFTTNSEKCPPHESMHSWTLIMDCDTLSKVPREVKTGLTGVKKPHGEVCLHFQLQLNTIVFLNVHTDKNIRD
jgi:hypothetical protein